MDEDREITTADNLSKCELTGNSDHIEESDVVYKFINGEITFDDYLNSVDQDENSGTTKSNEGNEETVAHTDSPAEENELLADNLANISFSESEESDIEKPPSKKNVGRKKRTQRNQLSRTLQAVMGQANVCYAKGETETAVKMCLEIIKEEPHASEPFRTLASIYEEIGQSEKSLQMRLIAAHLGPANKDEWVDLGSALKKTNQFRNAAVCFTKAIRLDVLNVSLYELRAELLKSARMSGIEDYGFHRLMTKLDPKEHASSVMYVRRKVASLYYADEKYEKAYDVLSYVFEKCAELSTLDDVKLYTDIMMALKEYSKCLDYLNKYYEINVETKMENDEFVVTKCVVPESTSFDVREKVIIILCNFKSLENVRLLLKSLSKEDPEKKGNSFFNIATVLAETELYEEAIKLFLPLTKISSLISIKLWFKLAHCYKNLNKLDECRECYRSALGSFPDNDEIQLKFFNELKASQLYREAIEISKDSKHSLLIYERCKLFEQLNETDNFIESALDLFNLHRKYIDSQEDFNFFIVLFRLSKGFKDRLSQVVSVQFDNSVTVEEEWEIFSKVCKLYVERREYDLLQHLTTSLYLSFKFMPKRKELRFATLVSCILNNSWELGFDLARYLIIHRSEETKRLWNVFNVATYKTEYTRLHKFLSRFLLRNPSEDHALSLYANCSLFAGTYKYALNDYSLLYDKYKTPLLALLMALSMLHIACQRFTKSKHTLVTQMIAFLTKYESFRGTEADQEIFYNIGRAFHQLELLPQAIFYYKKALNSKPAVDDPRFNLQCDIAFNLHLIYLNSGHPQLANMYLQEYIVI